MGHNEKSKDELKHEFAQSFSLFLQLADHFGIDLEEVWYNEIKIMEQRFPKTEWKKYMDKFKDSKL